MEMVMAQRSRTTHKENRTPWQDVTSTWDTLTHSQFSGGDQETDCHLRGPTLTLLWKLKMVTERHTRVVMPRHRNTDLVL